MNTDVEGSRSQPLALFVRTTTTVEELPERRDAEQIKVDLLSQWRVDSQNGASSASLSTVSRPMARSERAGVVAVRLVSHGTVLLLLAAALLVSRLSWARSQATPASPGQTFKQRILLIAPSRQVSYSAASRELSPRFGPGVERGFLWRLIPPVTVDTPDLPEESALLGRGGSRFINAGFVTRGIDPEGSLVPVLRTGIVTYTVRYGDTLWDIAAKFNIAQDTLWANNDLPSPDMLSVGEELTVPPLDGLIYTVRRGDTLAGLAKRYRTTVEAIVGYAPNGLSADQELAVGRQIIIPGGVKPIPARRTVSLTSAPPGALKGAGAFVMPVSGILTQSFRPGHPAIDIGAPKGAPVYAADAGYVSFAGWHPWGYGYAVEIDHGNGFRTLYAHLSWYAPDLGQSVKRGELIGGVGSTYGSGGWASGPHLHFEIIQKGAKRNPCVFLACP